MKTIFKYTLIALLFLMAAPGEMTAKRVKTSQMYMFGFSASFKDSVIYITDIQDVQGAWIDSKSKFLLGRDIYSTQLQEHFNKQQQPNRVCAVYFDASRKKIEKLYEKIKKKYVLKHPGMYDVRYLTATDFKFEAVDMSPNQE